MGDTRLQGLGKVKEFTLVRGRTVFVEQSTQGDEILPQPYEVTEVTRSKVILKPRNGRDSIITIRR